MDYRFTTVVTNKPAPGQGWDWIKKSMVVYDKYDNSGNLLKNSVTSYKDRDYQSTYEKTDETQSSNKLSSSFERDFTYDVDFTETHYKTYAKFDGYQEQKDSLTTTRNKWRASSMQSYFSATGELMYVRGSSDEVKGHDRYIVNNRDGQTLFRQDGTKRQEYYYSNGNSLGNTGTLLLRAKLPSHFQPN